MLQVIDIVIMVVGCVTALVVTVRIIRSGRWRDPLAGVDIAMQGPHGAAIAGVMLVFFGAQLVAGSALLGADAPALDTPGSDAWHRSQSAVLLAEVVACAFMVLVLAGSGTPLDRRRGPGLARGLGVGVVGVLALLPIMTLQLQMGEVLWQWTHPDASPPTHAVLLALDESAWGTWGVVELVLAAVLVAPLVEELFFRGVLLGALWRHTQLKWFSIVLSSVAFGLVHAQPQDVLPLITMGSVLGYIRLRCNSLWPCIVLHVLFNGRTMAFALLAPEWLDAT